MEPKSKITSQKIIFLFAIGFTLVQLVDAFRAFFLLGALYGPSFYPLPEFFYSVSPWIRIFGQIPVCIAFLFKLLQEKKPTPIVGLIFTVLNLGINLYSILGLFSFNLNPLSYLRYFLLMLSDFISRYSVFRIYKVTPNNSKKTGGKTMKVGLILLGIYYFTHITYYLLYFISLIIGTPIILQLLASIITFPPIYFVINIFHSLGLLLPIGLWTNIKHKSLENSVIPVELTDPTQIAPICPECESQLAPGAKFCTNCGSKIL